LPGWNEGQAHTLWMLPANNLFNSHNLPHIFEKWVIISAIPACRPSCHSFQNIEFAQLAPICCL
jgi:hypothetical protein